MAIDTVSTTSSQNAMKYFVVISLEGPEIVEVPEELAPHFSSRAGFNSRSQAERCVQSIPISSGKQRNANAYPNSSTHWVESNPRNSQNSSRRQRTLSPDPTPPAVQTPPTPTTPPADPTTSQAQLPHVEPIVLSEGQLLVLNMVKSGKSVFFTGPAGTGKSVLTREILKTLRDRNLVVAVTASTGIAAVHIGGSTVHSFAGIGLGKEKADVLVKRIKGSFQLRKRWRTTDVLIIDEISMIDGKLFDKLEYIAREVRDSQLPFGGIQLIISGDFFQLPPVPGKSNQYHLESAFAFDAESWERCVGKPVQLTKVFRQKDSAFVDILSSMRLGEVSDDHINRLAALSRPLHFADGIEPTCLFAIKAQVQACNTERLDSLPGPQMVYDCMDYRGVDVHGEPISMEEAKKLLEDEIALSQITIKVGAQVMLISNVIQGCLVNGSVGKVTDFMTTHEALRKHIQVVEMKKHGLSSGYDAPPAPKRPRIETHFEQMNRGQFTKDEKWPLVEFTNGLMLLCAPTNFTVEGFMGNVEAKRVQVPLILAWAMSMHKSQGQTLERVKVDMGKIFEKGQAYVALSRATSMEGLQIENFNPSKIEAHPRVIAWQTSWMPPEDRTSGSRTHASPHSGSSISTPLAKTRIVSVTGAGPSNRQPYTPVRGSAQVLPSPQSMVRRPSARPVQRGLLDPDEEMDSDEAISHYYDSLPK